MTMPPASPITGRMLALGLLVGLAALVWLGVVDPIVQHYHDNNGAIRDGVRALAALNARLAEGRRQRPSLGAEALERYRGDFLGGAEDPIIIADLQARLSSLITTRAGELNTAQALPPKARDGLDYLGLRLQFRAEMKNVQEILYALEASAPLLFVERAALRLDERTGGDRGRSAESIAPMTVEIDIYGAKWPPSPTANASGQAR